MFSGEDFTHGPYLKAKEHYDLFVEHVWESKASLSEKALKSIKHLSIGILFSIPIINIIAMIGYAILSKHCEPVIHVNGLAVPSNTVASPLSRKSVSDRDSLSDQWDAIKEMIRDSLKKDMPKVVKSLGYVTTLLSDIELEDHSLMLTHPSDFHEIHTHLTRITKALTFTDVDKVLWFNLLHNLETVRFHYPNHTVHLLDLTRERFIFDHPTHHYTLDLSAPESLSSQELAEVSAIEKESFSSPLSSRAIRNLVRKPESKIILAKLNEKVVGVLTYMDGTITSVARQADAVMGIGMALFKKLNEELAESPPVFFKLQVRKSNAAAIGLYERIGFTAQRTLSNYYSYPKEDGWLMTCEEMRVDT